MNTTNAKNRNFFNSKEAYMNFVQAWKKFHEEGKHQETYLTVHHHMVYNLIRGKDLSKSFTPKEKKRHDGEHPYSAFYNAKGYLLREGKLLDDKNHKFRWDPIYKKQFLEYIRHPFGDSLPEDVLINSLNRLKDVNL